MANKPRLFEAFLGLFLLSSVGHHWLTSHSTASVWYTKTTLEDQTDPGRGRLQVYACCVRRGRPPPLSLPVVPHAPHLIIPRKAEPSHKWHPPPPVCSLPANPSSLTSSHPQSSSFEVLITRLGFHFIHSFSSVPHEQCSSRPFSHQDENRHHSPSRHIHIIRGALSIHTYIPCSGFGPRHHQDNRESSFQPAHPALLPLLVHFVV